MSLEGWNGVGFFPLTRMEINLEKTQDMIQLVNLCGMSKKMRVSPINDHSRLSKAFSKIVFRIMLVFFFHLFEMRNIFLKNDCIVIGSSGV